MDANRLKRLIGQSRETQKNIASALGLSQQRFNNYVTGQREPDPETLCILADYFGVSVDYLLGRDADEAPSEAQAISAAKLALFGGDGEVTDEMWDEALFAAKLIKERYRRKDDAGG